MRKIKISGVFHLSVLFLAAIIFGSSLGFLLAETQNIENTEYFTEFTSALSTKLLDINGEIITEFASDEKRDIIEFQDLPQNLVDALITREDRVFFSHNGFTFKAIFRAFAGKILNQDLGGGSTLTQQIAGTLYCDRREMSIKRKIKELWWAIQMERRYTKTEILESYLNKIYFGGGTYGVSAASKYYFGHDSSEITPAEAGILVIQLSNPAYYNPFDHPDRAMARQKDVLDAMVKSGYITQAEADSSYDDYWSTFDFTRTSQSVYYMREDKAPWFSEYVRRELSNMIYGSDDINTSGFTVNTTVNLAHQQVAEEVMTKWIAEGNRRYKLEHSSKTKQAYSTYIPMAELIAGLFGIPGLNLGRQRSFNQACSKYISEVNPVIDLIAMLGGCDTTKLTVSNRGTELLKEQEERTTIEGTMISIENETGYINALVGGSKYDAENQFIRATQSTLQPGSTFKPLYYSAAIDSKKFTPTTLISDTPVVFKTADGKDYIPLNFRGEWMGNVCVYYALIHSMNVPSIKVLDGIGFDAAINRAIDLLGIPENEVANRGFTPGYPIGLGVCSVKPIELARAFAVFANGGKEVTPIAIRNVQDRNGETFLNPEKDIKDAQAAKGDKVQVISPQTAFVMTKMLEQTVHGGGTLAAQDKKLDYVTPAGVKYRIPSAGKTGTTQNWADAWTAGFSPYYTAAFWFGFDKRGQSLGLNITGSTLAGYAWGEYFSQIHADLPSKDWKQPAEGVVQMTVCSVSGDLITKNCTEGRTTQWFLAGTQPTKTCKIHNNSEVEAILLERLDNENLMSGLTWDIEIDDKPFDINEILANLENDDEPAIKEDEEEDLLE